MIQRHSNTLREYIEKDISLYDPGQLYTTFKSLRDMTISSVELQTKLCGSDILDYTIVIVSKILNSNSEELLSSVKQALQFIYNLTVNNEENKIIIWNKRERLKECLKSSKVDGKYVAGTFYNIVFDNSALLSEIVKDNELIYLILESVQQGSDFAVLFIELVLRHSELVSHLLNCNTKFHIDLLQMLQDFTEENEVNTQFIQVINDHYKMKCIKLKIEDCSVEMVQEVFILLKILIYWSTKEETNCELRKDLELLKSTKILLKTIHFQGKKKGDMFAPSQDLFTDDTEVMNVKTNLIRLIANLCLRNEKFQNWMRESEGLPLILDCCPRDGKNPFITETVVFTIRNLCEDNLANQVYIRNLNKQAGSTHNKLNYPCFDM